VEEHSVDVLVIGSGAAGLRAAAAAGEGGARVLLLSKGTAGLGTATIISYGAFASAGFGQSIEEHIRKTVATGHHRNDPSLVKVLSEEAPEKIRELRHKGVRFRETPHGVIAEGKFPILGRRIVGVLLEWAKDMEVQIVSWITAISLIEHDGRVVGCVGLYSDGKAVMLSAKAVVLCTGGASGIFRFHDNPVTNIGEGYAMASRCGAEVRDMEFIQFYPLLISEARLPRILAPPSLVEKGKVINDAGEDILAKYGLLDLRPVAIRGRDRLSIAIYQEIMGGRKVFLDVRAVTSADASLDPFDKETVMILESRYGSASRLLRVAPCAHFTIGGIVIDDQCRTSKEGLFAAGEVACGIHGANRMGGNALTETLVFGFRAGRAAATYAADCRPGRTGGMKAERLREELASYETGKHQASAALRVLQGTMWENCGPVREGKGLFSALNVVENLKEEGICCGRSQDLAISCSVRNSLETAGLIIKAAIERKESIGAHHRVAE
jgi:fumarate reductase (CoM/CoB) subunit A